MPSSQSARSGGAKRRKAEVTEQDDDPNEKDNDGETDKDNTSTRREKDLEFDVIAMISSNDAVSYSKTVNAEEEKADLGKEEARLKSHTLRRIREEKDPRLKELRLKKNELCIKNVQQAPAPCGHCNAEQKYAIHEKRNSP